MDTITNYAFSLTASLDVRNFGFLEKDEHLLSLFKAANKLELNEENYKELIGGMVYIGDKYPGDAFFMGINVTFAVREVDWEKHVLSLVHSDIGQMDEWRNVLRKLGHSPKAWFLDHTSDFVYEVTKDGSEIAILAYDYESRDAANQPMFRYADSEAFLRKINEYVSLHSTILDYVEKKYESDTTLKEALLAMLSVQFRVERS